MKPIKVMSIFGVRPEAVKMAPLINKIKEEADLENIVVVTAQHREMLDQVLKVFNITPDYDLNIMKKGQTLSSITIEVLQGLDSIISETSPDIILVHGDPTTSFAAALSAFYHKIPVGHVEAGLRSHNKYSPYPEEMNRIMTGHIANYHFCPTESNANNLKKENITENIFITGNTAIDALHYLVRDDYKFKSESVNKIALQDKRTIFMTAHRSENIGTPMENIFNAVKEIALRYNDVQFIYSLHRNPAVVEIAERILSNIDNIHLIEPLEVDDTHNLMNKCYFVMTDSGGLQEEAPALGKPVLVLRKETERPEAVEMGTVRIAGIEKENIINEASKLLDNVEEYNKMAKAVNPYGDGKAAERIIKIIKNIFLI